VEGENWVGDVPQCENTDLSEEIVTQQSFFLGVREKHNSKASKRKKNVLLKLN